MKKLFIVLFVILSVTAWSLSTASAMDFLLGAKAGYFVWDPYLKRSGSPMYASMENGSGQLYGPVFSMLFTSDFSLSLSGLFGEQLANWAEMDYVRGGSNLLSSTYNVEITRRDVDTALSYRLTENFKLFAGYKYQYFNMTIEDVYFSRNISTGVQSGGYEKIEIEMPFNGPAAGIGFSTQIGERFFFAANLSGLYMWGKFKFDYSSYYYSTSGGAMLTNPGPSGMDGITMNARGINCEPTIGVSTGDGLPIVTLGVRFQWSQTEFHGMPSDSGMKDGWMNDYQYGIFVSVVQPI